MRELERERESICVSELVRERECVCVRAPKRELARELESEGMTNVFVCQVYLIQKYVYVAP